METKPTIETVLERMAEQTAVLQELVREITSVKALTPEVAAIKVAQQTLMTEVLTLKSEQQTMKAMLQEIDTRTRRIDHRITVLAQDMLDLRATMQRIDADLLAMKTVG
ncbi:hypothetical protein [Chloracidobacterium thermophilum]|uniref:hypothetical protein n=1 Tax=Chloracidobacterium thermophilum TaxID=458033 RepID=UPI0007389C8D|nr:hypothetical protein [Chloracidobacterium thermophilum]